MSYYRILQIFLIGAMSGLAFAPRFFFPLLFISQTLLLIFIKKSKNKTHAFTNGFAFGVGHFMVGIYWIYHSLLVDIEKFAWLIPFVIILLPSLLAIYIGLVALITYSVRKSSILIFSISWVFIEYLRGHLFSGFPWNLIGYSLGFSQELIQVAGIFGVYGLSFMVMLVTSLPYLWISKSAKRYLGSAMIISSFAIMYIYGHYQLQPPTKYSDIAIRIVQPATKQQADFDLSREQNNIHNLIELSNNISELKPKYVIWPEGSFMADINYPGLLQLIKYAVPDGGYLITPAINIYQQNNQNHWSNSLFVIDKHGEKIQEYKKNHLVPFGEYIPLRWILPFEKIVSSIINVDCSPGNNVHNISHDNLPVFRPLICYEDIFADEVKTDNQAKWILSVTNDSWFGTSEGPYQHFHMSRFRAIEQGLGLVRAAKTGISAVIDPQGRILKQTLLEQKTFLDSYLPLHRDSKTIYSIYGDSIILIIMMLFLLHIYFKLNEKNI